MKLFRAPNLLMMIGGLLSACASIENELFFTAEQMGAFQVQGKALGIEVEKEDYFRARALWPWASGESLHRRALIVGLRPSKDELKAIGNRPNERAELRTLQSLLTRRR